MSTELEKQKYVAAAWTALSKGKWRQLISISEHILRLEEEKRKSALDNNELVV
jgi:hypothetical protein